eukprot:2604055-Pyramimonas_sp.AAC.1
MYKAHTITVITHTLPTVLYVAKAPAAFVYVVPQADELMVGESMRRVTITGASKESTNEAQRMIAFVVHEHHSQAGGGGRFAGKDIDGKFWIRIVVPNITVA